jgi:hypothetical protein
MSLMNLQEIQNSQASVSNDLISAIAQHHDTTATILPVFNALHCRDEPATETSAAKRRHRPDLTVELIPMDQIRLDLDGRPVIGYSSLIGMALTSTPKGQMILADIYNWIQSYFPYFKTTPITWKVSIITPADSITNYR